MLLGDRAKIDHFLVICPHKTYSYYGYCFFLISMLDVAGLQNEDGSFSGDMWGEIDTR